MKKVKLNDGHNWTDSQFARSTTRPTYREQYLTESQRRNRIVDLAVIISCGACLVGLAIVLILWGQG